jgi:hypothetical protein
MRCGRSGEAAIRAEEAKVSIWVATLLEGKLTHANGFTTRGSSNAIGELISGCDIGPIIDTK